MREPIFFDLETFADHSYSLKKLSDVQYTRDPRFELLSVAATDGVKMSVWRGDDDAWLKQFRTWDAEGRRFVAHNARFDLRVLALRYEFIPTSVGDTLAVARYHWFGDHKLNALAKRLFHIGKQGEPLLGRHLRDMTPTEWKALVRYNAADVALCRKLWELLVPRLPDGELDLIQQTLRLQLRSQAIDAGAAKNLAESKEQERAAIVKQHPVLPDLATKHVQLKTHVQQHWGVSLPSVDKKKVGELSQLPLGAQDFLRNLWSYKALTKAIKDITTLQSRMGLAKGGVLIDLNYCGAHSHRWTSGGGEGGRASFNYQNLSKHAGIRELNIPRSGNVFIIGDLAQIEARITAWLASEEDQLRAFQDGQDVYLSFAEQLFRRSLTRSDGFERSVGKVSVLGLGFGMGGKRFAEQLALTVPESVDRLQAQFDVHDPESAAQHVVERYRKAYPRIHGNVRDMYDAFRNLALDPLQNPIAVGNYVTVRREDAGIVTELPTGGYLTYRDVRLDERAGRYGRRMGPTYLNKTVSFSMPIENAVQAIARDIFARALQELEWAGFEIAFHIHDEVIVEVPAEAAATRLAEFKRILGAPDARCPGLPIACDAFLSDRYTKDEKYMRSFTERLVASEPVTVPT